MTRLLCFAALGLGLTSCLNNAADTCQTTIVTSTLAAVGPKTVAVNQPAVFTLNYEIAGACGTFSNIAEQIVGTTRYVGVNVLYNGCNCPSATIPKQTTYTFQPTQAGTYYLQFVTTTGYISDTLVAR